MYFFILNITVTVDCKKYFIVKQVWIPMKTIILKVWCHRGLFAYRISTYRMSNGKDNLDLLIYAHSEFFRSF